jgi:outer membrane immunogenic protein
MRRTLSIAMLIVGFGATTAYADGMPRGYGSGPACAQFGGAYIGINGGWASHDKHWVDRDNWIDNFAFDFNSSNVSKTRDGATVGGQIGYNWQRRCTVLGIETDANWANLDGTEVLSPFAGGTTLTLNDNVTWFGTTRLRAGVVVDNLMLYVTGGLAYAGIKHDFRIVDPGIPATERFSTDNSRWGAALGVGAEWLLAGNWTVKGEALYLKFEEDRTSGFSAAGNQTVHFDTQDSIWVARLGLNYKFGGDCCDRPLK